MTITYEMNEKESLIGDLVSRAIWEAYKLGIEEGNLNSVGFSGCEKNKNFSVSLDISDLI
jgi:hypothetical protein